MFFLVSAKRIRNRRNAQIARTKQVEIRGIRLIGGIRDEKALSVGTLHMP
jgi:hypothetical protein